jgi:hypothetical protein
VARVPFGVVKKRLRHLPTSLIAVGVLLILGTPVAGLAVGWDGVGGLAAGVALVAVSYLVSSLVVAWVDLVARSMLLVVVLTTYVLKFTIFGVVMWNVAETDWTGLPTMGVAIIAATIVWTSAQLWWMLHAKIPYVELDGG